MGAEILDSVVIVNCHISVLIFNQFIHSTKAIFHYEQRLLIAIIQVVEGNSQTQRVDLPAPFTGLQIRIL